MTTKHLFCRLFSPLESCAMFEFDLKITNSNVVEFCAVET
jgi:hypothetical protein